MSTHKAKKNYDHATLRLAWIEHGKEIKLAEYQPVKAPRCSAASDNQIAREAIDFAVEHLSEREAASAAAMYSLQLYGLPVGSPRAVQSVPNWIDRSSSVAWYQMDRASG